MKPESFSKTKHDQKLNFLVKISVVKIRPLIQAVESRYCAFDQFFLYQFSKKIFCFFLASLKRGKSLKKAKV